MQLFKNWRQDFQASLVVFLVALPLCLGIALASNAPLVSGLLAGMIGGLVIGSISGSPISVSGPAAGLTIIVAGSIKSLGAFEVFTLAVFLSGIFQILFGLLKGGIVGSYFPTSVIKGMLAAIGLILILKQLPHAVGYHIDYIGDQAFRQGDGENTFSEIFLAFNWLHFGAAIISLLSIGIMLIWEKASHKGLVFFKLIPGALVAVIMGIIMNEMFGKFLPHLALDPRHLVQLPFKGGLTELLNAFRFPDWTGLMNPEVYKVALTVAVVGSLETLLSIEAADKLDESAQRTPKDRELFAQGVGNALSGLVGGIPMTAVIVRSSANATAGAKSKLSAILHGFWLLACIISIPQFLNLIPLSVLASVLLLVGLKLTKPEIYKSTYSKGANQFIPFIATILAILFTDLLVGIMVGLAVGFFFVLRSNMHKSIVSVSDGERVLIRFYKDVSFLQKAVLTRLFDQIPPGTHVLIDGSKPVFVDNDIEELIANFIKQAADQNIRVELKKSSLALSPVFKEESDG